MQPADSETRATLEDHKALRLWLRLLACSNLIEASVRTRLRKEFGSTLPRFDLLSQLERAPQGLSMGELSKRMMVSCGNVTGLASSLVAQGLITREPLPNNKRTYQVKLTPEGRKEFAVMAEAHEAWIIDLFQGVNGREIDRLMELLGKLKTGIRRHHQAET